MSAYEVLIVVVLTIVLALLRIGKPTGNKKR